MTTKGRYLQFAHPPLQIEAQPRSFICRLDVLVFLKPKRRTAPRPARPCPFTRVARYCRERDSRCRRRSRRRLRWRHCLDLFARDDILSFQESWKQTQISKRADETCSNTPLERYLNVNTTYGVGSLALYGSIVTVFIAGMLVTDPVLHIKTDRVSIAVCAQFADVRDGLST